MMEVELYVYDLSQGMARQYSMALAGVQIDAIYHTAIVLNGVEYFFGQGIHRKVPGSTHHGRPMNVVKLGQTHLSMDVVQEYIESLESIYTPESYDLFLHNCNNFSQDLAMFLVGKDIPQEIRTLPETFLRTPIGQMLRGQLDQSMRQMTQAPDAASGQNVISSGSRSAANGNSMHATPSASGASHKPVPLAILNGVTQDAGSASVQGYVHNVTSITALDNLLRAAQASCACIFFTSQTCPPCKICYQPYDELAAEAGDKALLIKVDISDRSAMDIAMRYQVAATPTFITFLRGKQEEIWKGADPARLRGNIRLLIQMANPSHPHSQLRLPNLRSRVTKPIVYPRMPPLDKLMGKIGPAANDKAIQDLVLYIRTRETKGLENAPLPNLHEFSDWITSSYSSLPREAHFAIVDLLRVAAVDSRVSSYLTAESANRILSTLIPIATDSDYASKIPYNLQAVTLQLLCNLFSSPNFQTAVQPRSSSNMLRTMTEEIASASLLSSHPNARSLAAALTYNLAAYDHNQRLDDSEEKCQLGEMVDLEAALVEAVVNEDSSKETLRALLLALGLFLYGVPTVADSSIWDLCMAMDVRQSLKDKARQKVFQGEDMIREIGEELLAKGGKP